MESVKMEGELLPPPPPAGATLPPSVKEQRERVKEAFDEASELTVGDIWCPVALIWYTKWKDFVGYDRMDDSDAFIPAEEMNPGKLDNSALRATEEGAAEGELSKGLVLDRDFVLVPEGAYTLLKEWYTGGPDFPRRVIAMGTGSHEDRRVELFPYFVSYTSADSVHHCGVAARERPGGLLVLDSTMAANAFINELSRVSGIDVIYAELYSVATVLPAGESRPSAGEGCNMKMETPPEEDAEVAAASASIAGEASPSPSQYQLTKLCKKYPIEQTLEELLYGQTRVQLFIENRKWRFELKSGDRIDARDEEGHWYDSVVQRITPPAEAPPSSMADDEARQPKAVVHYRCWESRWDTEIAVTSERIQPLYTKAPDWRHFHVGMLLEVKPVRNFWFVGRVEEVDAEAKQVLVSWKDNSQRGTFDFDTESLSRSFVHLQRNKNDEDGTSTDVSSTGRRLSTSSPLSSSLSTSTSGTGYVLGTGAAAASGSGLLGRAHPSSSFNSTGGLYPRRGSGDESSVTPGAVGLVNLGNTCFMNSMLQCLNMTGPLTSYFLAEKYEAEINEKNPLGMKGLFARTFAQLLKDIWSGSSSAVAPTAFKRIIAQVAPQFAGYQQHDSQELMSFVLDALHEDLNRVQQKPYVQVKDYDGEPDAQLAGEAWRAHIRRNDSIVVDHCQGQYKSHVTCPKCGYESVTFDPYLSLTLPLPVKSMVKIKFIFHPLPLGSRPISVAAFIPQGSTAKALKTWIVANLISQGKKSDHSESTSKSPIKKEEGVNGHGHTAAGPAAGLPMLEGTGKVKEEEPQVAASALPRSPEVIDLAELYDNRLYKGFEDNDPIADLIRVTPVIQAFELEHVPTLSPSATSLSGSSGTTRPFTGIGQRLGGLGSSKAAAAPPPAASLSNIKKQEEEEGEQDIKKEVAKPEPQQPPREDTAIATVLFAKKSSSFSFSGKSYDRFGTPFRLTISSTRTTNRDVHQRVWKATSRFLKEDAVLLREKEGRLPYRILFSNMLAGIIGDVEQLPENDELFDLPHLLAGHKALMVTFDNASFLDNVNKDLLDVRRLHASVQQDGVQDTKKPIELRQCFEKFSEREQLGEQDLWYCSKCKERLQAYKKMDVWSLPDVLILHVKRFSYVQGHYSSHVREKIEDLVLFPLEGLDLSDVMRGPVDPEAPPVYDLYAVSEHSGGLGGGHYTAVAKHFKTGTWYAFNDSMVSPLNSEEIEKTVVTSRAYVLFYQRRKGSLKWAGAKVPSLVSPGADGKGEKDGAAPL